MRPSNKACSTRRLKEFPVEQGKLFLGWNKPSRQVPAAASSLHPSAELPKADVHRHALCYMGVQESNMRIEASHMVVIDSYRMLLVVKIVHLNNGLVSSYPSYPNECLSKQHWIRTFFAPRNSNTETKSMDPLQSLSLKPPVASEGFAAGRLGIARNQTAGYTYNWGYIIMLYPEFMGLNYGYNMI